MFVILFYDSGLLSTSNCSVDLYNGGLQTTTVLFTCNFTQGWWNFYYYSSSALSCLFIVQHKQSNESSWSRTFVFSVSRELYCNFIFVCVLWTHYLLLLLLLSISFILILMLLFGLQACCSCFYLPLLMLNDDTLLSILIIDSSDIFEYSLLISGTQHGWFE